MGKEAQVTGPLNKILSPEPGGDPASQRPLFMSIRGHQDKCGHPSTVLELSPAGDTTTAQGRRTTQRPQS